MEGAFGADFSGVRMHVGGQADELSNRIQAKAFTTGNDVFVRSQNYAPETRAGQTLIAHELTHTLQQGESTVSRSYATQIFRKYTDIPTAATFKGDSDLSLTRRVSELKNVDVALADYEPLRSGTDLGLKRKQMFLILAYIREWEKAKTPAGVAKSDRTVFLEDLKQVLEAKVQENLDDHAVELAPLAGEYLQAAADQNMDLTLAKATELYEAHDDLMLKTAAGGLKTKDMGQWATLFFNAPPAVAGMNPFNSLTIKNVADFSWMTKAQADRAIRGLILPSLATNKDPVLQMLQIGKFRNALVNTASDEAADELKSMPLVRVAMAAEADVAKKGPAPTVKDIADSVFACFLGDLPITQLGYATNSAEFSTPDFLLGNTKEAQRAPCMTLSNVLTQIFKAVLPGGDPLATPRPIQDGSPMLTKPLASIGTGNGVLTREKSFHGNVERMDNVSGYDKVNRIFFGDGHEWLEVDNTEYDPTLGISGPIGTVKAQVESLTFAKKGSKYAVSDGRTATRNSHKPPGGAALLFQRSVVIK